MSFKESEGEREERGTVIALYITLISLNSTLHTKQMFNVVPGFRDCSVRQSLFEIATEVTKLWKIYECFFLLYKNIYNL